MDPTDARTTAAGGSRAEAERLIGVSEKLLQSRDLAGAREFALLAQETDSSLLEGSDQILAITDVLMASEKRVNNNRQHDFYAILQTPRHTLGTNPDLLRKNYRRLALLLHPDKNPLPLAPSAFKLVSDAWSFLSDPSKRTPYDHQLSVFEKVDLRRTPPPPTQQPPSASAASGDKLPVRRGSVRGDVAAPPHSVGNGNGKGGRFWTACPYCYVMYEYEKEVEEYCVRCQNCERAFHAASIPSLPPMVPGKEAYYCCWGFFPLGFQIDTGAVGGGNNKGGKKVDSNPNQSNAAAAAGNNNNNGENGNGGMPNWMPGMFTTPGAGGAQGDGVGNVNTNNNRNNVPNMNVNAGGGGGGATNVVDFSAGSGAGGSAAGGFRSAVPGASAPGAKKRGRPRKNPMGV